MGRAIMGKTPVCYFSKSKQFCHLLICSEIRIVGVAQVIGRRFKATPAYTDWNQRHKDLRNGEVDNDLEKSE